MSLKKRVRRIVVASIGLIIFQQLCGANAIIFRGEEVFDRLSPVDDVSARAPIYAIVLSATQVNMAFYCPIHSSPKNGIYIHVIGKHGLSTRHKRRSCCAQYRSNWSKYWVAS